MAVKVLIWEECRLCPVFHAINYRWGFAHPNINLPNNHITTVCIMKYNPIQWHYDLPHVWMTWSLRNRSSNKGKSR